MNRLRPIPTRPDRHRTRRPRGFTLVEVLLFGAIGLVVLSTAWFLFIAALHRGTDTDERLHAVQGTLVLCRTLEQDLAGLFEDDEHRITYTRQGVDYLLEFFTFSPVSNDGEWDPLRLVRITYRLDGATGKIVRQAGNAPTRRLPGTFEQLGVRFVDPVAAGDPDAGRAPNPDDAPPPPAARVTVAITAIPHRLLKTPRAKRSPADRTVVFVTAPRPVSAGPVAYPHWNFVPYGAGAPVLEP